MKPVFVINNLSETVAKKGSKLASFKNRASAVFDADIFDTLDLIVAAGEKSGWVIIEGGDGTAQGIISAFFNQLGPDGVIPKFTLLPGGMTNQVAKNIGLKPLSERAISRLLDSPPKIIPTPLLKVTSAEHPDYYGFLFSTGGVPMITAYTKEKLHSKGIGGSAAVLGGILKGLSGQDNGILSATEVSLRVDEHEIKGRHLGTLVTTLPSLLLKLDPFWGRGTGPLRMTYVEDAAKRLPAHALGLWLGRKSKDRRADGLHSHRAHALTYNYSGPVVLDGESLALGTSFSVSATPPVAFIS